MILSLLVGLPLTEKYNDVPDVGLPNNEAKGEKGEVFAVGYYVIGLTKDKKKLIVIDNLYDEYTNYQTWNINTIISLTCIRDGKIQTIRNINELCIGDEIDIIVSEENWKKFEYDKVKKRSPYLDKEEVRKIQKSEANRKRKEETTKQQKELKEKFRKQRQDYLDELKVTDLKLYKIEMKVGNQYDEVVEKPKRKTKKQRRIERQTI